MKDRKKIAVVTGAGGFIGGHLVKRLLENGMVVRAVDIKPVSQWHQLENSLEVENYGLTDCADPKNCENICRHANEVYNLAADMGGMGFIEKNRVACLRSVLINANLIEAACSALVERYFFASSACVYNTQLQDSPQVTALKESDAYPAMAERGYGWEKLFSEMVCQEYAAERKLKTFIARFHNVYGPHGTWQGGREKAPAAICRKVIEARWNKSNTINIWGDGNQTRSFMYIDDCITGIDLIMHCCPDLVGVPINLGSSELVSINELVTRVEAIAQVKLKRTYDLTAPKGVNGRNSDNSKIVQMLGWEPGISLNKGLLYTYEWIATQMYQCKFSH
jgi:nucleoside-diphosphate-sugar epimerase